MDHPAFSTSRATLIAVITAGLVGISGGAITHFAENVGDSPVWFSVVHSLSLWAMLALLVGFAFRHVWWRAALAGLVTQIGLVLGYYVTRSTTWLPFETESATTYGLVAIVAGPLFGAAAVGLHDDHTLFRTLSLGLSSAPWLVDGNLMLMRAGAGSHFAAMVVLGACFIAVGVCLPVLIARSRTSWLGSLGVAACAAGFIVLVGAVA